MEEKPTAAPGSAASPGNARRKKGLALFLAAVVLTVAAGGGYWWYRQTHISTDDAYIEGRIHPVSSRVPGTVAEVLVRDNQPVKAGDPLLRIDPEPYRLRVEAAASALAAAESDRTAARSDIDAAKADIEAARQAVAAAEAQLDQAKAAVSAARSKVSLAEVSLAQADRDLARAKGLFERHSLSRERFEKITTGQEEARARLDLARDELRLAEAAVPTAEAQVAGKRSFLTQRKAILAQREARIGQISALLRRRRSALAEAKLSRGYTEITAPADGWVTRKSVEVGQVVSPGQPLLAVTDLTDLWVVANYKETQIEKIRPGQEVRIRVDTYPGRTFHGKVDSIMAGTGSAFSLFPSENATGNYVKVVQRVPVKILLPREEDPDHVLRVGMSVIPTVLVR
ncbi:MAG: HlyD family secretion protein [Deltaproteobacteria bacterium]